MTLSHPEGPRKLELMPLAGLWGGVWRYQLAHTTRSHLERRNDISLVGAQAQSLVPAINEYAPPHHPLPAPHSGPKVAAQPLARPLGSATLDIPAL